MHFIKKYKYIITITFIITLLIFFIYTKNRLNKERFNYEVVSIEKEEPLQEIVTEELCTIDIKGAVNKPGIYQTECNKYVHDIIDLAGGLTQNADTSAINLAKKITDEMVIIIYTKEEINNSKKEQNTTKVIDTECICPTVKNDGCINNENNETIKLININKATIDELKTLPGIGDSKAKAIIEYRNNQGYFKTPEDIKNVKGIGEKLYEEIKTFITT